jgi:Cd2+/Zn2+-exporting ATPase
VNQQGMIDVEVTAGAGDTTLARIARRRSARRRASRPRPNASSIKFSRRYTPAVVLIAIAIATVPLAFGEPFGPWLYKALVLLVIACPCALVISTPVTIVSGLAAAARRGLLVKGGAYLEQAGTCGCSRWTRPAP